MTLEFCYYCNSPFTLQVEPCIDNTSTVTSVDKPVAWYNILNSHLIQKFTLWLYGPSIGCHSCNKPTRVRIMNLLKLAWKLGFSNVNFLLLSGRYLVMLGWIWISDILLYRFLMILINDIWANSNIEKLCSFRKDLANCCFCSLYEKLLGMSIFQI